MRAENDLPKVFQWMADCQQVSDNRESLINRLDKELGNAGLVYRQLSTPNGVNYLFHAMHGQLLRYGRASQSATKLRSDLVIYFRRNPATPDGTHLSEFIILGAWNTYLRRMAMEGEWKVNGR